MLVNTQAIVLKGVKFKESSLILTVYTKDFGKEQLIVSELSNVKKTKNSFGFFQIGSLLDIIYYKKESQNLHRLKEYKWSTLYKEIWMQPIRTAQCIFFCEVVNQSVKEVSEKNLALFDFFYKVLLYCDNCELRQLKILTIYFLFHLIHFVGFGISNNFSSQLPYFDLYSATFISDQNKNIEILNKEDSILFSSIINYVENEKHLDNLPKYLLKNTGTTLEVLLKYYSIHIHNFSIKSLEIYKKIFCKKF